MDDIPLSALLIALFVLLVTSAFFSISETSMLALNRYRLRHLVQQRHRGARLASELLGATDRFLGVVLLGNNVINAAVALLVGEIARRHLGDSEASLIVATAAAAFAILVFSEITPKVVGAAYPERIALSASHVLAPLLHRDIVVAVLYLDSFSPRFPQLVDLKMAARFVRAIVDAVVAPNPDSAFVPSDFDQHLLRLSAREVERAHTIAHLEGNDWNLSDAARSMGVARVTVYARIERYGIPRLRVWKTKRRDNPEPEDGGSTPEDRSNS